MQTHTTPSAHVCTTLPPGDLPMRSAFPDAGHGPLYLLSHNGEVRRTLVPQYAPSKHSASPVGTWWASESRTDSAGERWIKDSSRNEYWVVDNWGHLVAVSKAEGGAA